MADTSFLYALFSEEDVFHRDAVRDAARYKSILIPPEIFSETMALVQYSQGFETAAKSGEWLRGQRGIRIPPPGEAYLRRAWRVFLASRGSLSYPDAVVVAWCRALRAAPLSYDEDITAAV